MKIHIGRMICCTSVLVSLNSWSACKNVWVDHDYNGNTPPVQKQICDSILDVPAVNLPGVQPIQSPTTKPVQTYNLPPLGTTQCTTQRVYDYGSGQWVDKRLCR